MPPRDPTLTPPALPNEALPASGPDGDHPSDSPVSVTEPSSSDTIPPAEKDAQMAFTRIAYGEGLTPSGANILWAARPRNRSVDVAILADVIRRFVFMALETRDLELSATGAWEKADS